MPDSQPRNDRPEPNGAGGTIQSPTMRIALIGAAVIAAGAIGLYGMGQQGDKPTAPGGEKPVAAAGTHTGACAKSLDAASAITPLAKGEVAGLTPVKDPQDLSSVAFDDADGKKTSVGAFKGKTILLNLWATWCVPCRAEMPALDKLEGSSGAKDFTVVPVNIDTTNPDKPRNFLKEIGATHLPFYSDKSADILQVLKKTSGLEGLPTSVLIGKDGCAIGVMSGPAVWDSPDAKALVRKASS